MELDKDTLDKLITHFEVMIKELNTPDPDEETELEQEYSEYSMGYNSAILTTITHLQLLREGELKLYS